MPDRLHLRRLRVVEVLEDAVERWVVAVQDLRTVVRCPFCGFLTSKVHERRRVKVHDLPHVLSHPPAWSSWPHQGSRSKSRARSW